MHEINPWFVHTSYLHIPKNPTLALLVIKIVSASNIFAELCKHRKIDFVPSRIGAYWNKNEEIDLVAIDESHKRMFAAECKYYKDDKPVDVNVYAKLTEKCQVDDFKGYDLTYGIFSKSGFTKHLRDIVKENKKLILINECSVVK